MDQLGINLKGIIMFFKKKVPEKPKLTVSEFLALDIRLNDIINQWCEKETAGGVRANTKLAELAIFNFKLIYSADDRGKLMRDFIQKTINVKEATDYTFSRIQDLYVDIRMGFPEYFISTVRNQHIKTLSDLGYDIDEDIVSGFEFGWLMARIQHSLRYHTSDILPPKK